MADAKISARKTPPSRAPSTWSRAGCLTCKRRRKKCDQTHPSCTNCASRGIPCEGYRQSFVFQTVQVGEPKKRSRARSTTQTRRPSPSSSSSACASSPSSPVLTTGTIRSEPPAEQTPFEPHPNQEGPAPKELTWCNQFLQPSAELTVSEPTDEHHTAQSIADHDTTTAQSLHEEGSEQRTLPRPLPAVTVSQSIIDPISLSTIVTLDQELGFHNLGRDEDDLDPATMWLGGQAATDALGSPQFLSMFPDFSDQDFYYLQYLDEQAATQLLNVDSGAFNPLRRLILPRALACAGVLNSICAVAACHKAQRSDPDARIELFVTATNFYLKSVNWLRASFDPEPERIGKGSLAEDATPILTALLLCKYEIIKGSAAHWRDHLDGLEHLLQMRGGISFLDPDCGQYVASFIRYHRRVYDICNCKKSPLSEDDSHMDAIASSNSSLDAYSGCAHHLLRACHDIAGLGYRLELKGGISYADFSDEMGKMRVPLGSIYRSQLAKPTLTFGNSISVLGTPIIEPDIQFCLGAITISQISRLLYVAQRTRYAAFVFLHSVTEYAVSTCGFSDSERDALRRQIPYTRVQALEGCLEMLAQTPVGDHCEFAGLALALFLAGCEVEEDDKRFLVLEKLFAIEHGFGLGHISRAKDALMMIWQQNRAAKRSMWWKTLRDIGWELIIC